MHRRDFIRLGMAGVGVCAAPAIAGPVARRPVPKLTATVITDISTRSDPATLQAVLDTVLGAGLPVSCAVDPLRLRNGRATADHPVVALLTKLAIRMPGLVDLVPVAPHLADREAFDMARTAYETREAFLSLFGLAGEGVAVQTIACHSEGHAYPPEGLLAAGFRTHLVIPRADMPVEQEIWDNGTVRLFGGQTTSFATAERQLGKTQPDEPVALLYLSAQGFETLGVEKSRQAAASFAKAASAGEMEAQIANLRVSDIVLRGTFGYRREIALHLVTPEAATAELTRALDVTKSRLTQLGFRFSEGPTVPVGQGERGYWIPSDPAHAPGRFALAGGYKVKPEPPSEAAALPPGFGLVLSEPQAFNQGVDGNGVMQFQAIPVSAFIDKEPWASGHALAARDYALVIEPQDHATAPKRAQLLKTLVDLADQGASRFVELGGFVRKRYPKSMLISRFQVAQEFRSFAPPVHARVAPDVRGDLIDDARLAWHYIESTTNPVTGLCPSTIFRNEMLETVTMWDVASQINGVMAAHDIGFFGKDEFRERIAAILPNLAGRTSSGRHLPQEWVKTNRRGTSNQNFDACDVGRLLGSLLNLSLHPSSDEDVAALVASWDLDAVIFDGKLHSVIDETLVEVFENHCAHYAARAFRAWGYDVASPYELGRMDRGIDGQMRLLSAASRIGIIGTEPLLLEALDFRLSPEADFLAETLFSAQADAFRKTGTLYCVSETPINRQPWFIYEGLDLDRETDEWVVEPTSDAPEYNTAAFKREVMAVSSKGAYLWAAARPHPFADRLVTYVRARAKTDVGFSPNVNSITGTATDGFADINTNGIILHSIAKILARGDA